MKYLLIMFAIFCTIHSFAQTTTSKLSFDNTHTNWNFDIVKQENKYLVRASVLLETGWHIFSSNPGGDGSLTSTELEINELKKQKTSIEFKEFGELHEKEIAGIGSVRFYENNAVFQIEFNELTNIKTLNGSVNFQICNDEMCMAPATKNFTLTIK